MFPQLQRHDTTSVSSLCLTTCGTIQVDFLSLVPACTKLKHMAELGRSATKFLTLPSGALFMAMTPSTPDYAKNRLHPAHNLATKPSAVPDKLNRPAVWRADSNLLISHGPFHVLV